MMRQALLGAGRWALDDDCALCQDVEGLPYGRARHTKSLSRAPLWPGRAFSDMFVRYPLLNRFGKLFTGT